jgi:hypothetical protein
MCPGGPGSIGVVGDAPEVILDLEGARLQAAAIAKLLLLLPVVVDCHHPHRWSRSKQGSSEAGTTIGSN